MLIKEFRIILPMSVEEYRVAWLYSVAEISKNETGGGDGIEVVKNEPFDDFPLLDGKFTQGQYSLKNYFLASKVPKLIKALMPAGAFELKEEAWNAFPYCKTVMTNPKYMKDNASSTIESMHVEDRGKTENVFQLNEDQLKKREVIVIDIADAVPKYDYNANEDPTTYTSEKTGRGPLINKDEEKWMDKVNPVMTCYKLVTCEFKWFGLQTQVESFLMEQSKRVFVNLHRQMFCSMDKWYGMTMDDIKAIEDKTKEELEKKRMEGELCGSKPDEK